MICVKVKLSFTCNIVKNIVNMLYNGQVNTKYIDID